ncbi:MAG: 50S ribosomal protein L21 [bacterium]|nr:50S ribosomal protein L21 [bacterium]
MFAVIETGGKQYKVEEGTILDLEKLEGNKSDNIVFEKVLLVADKNNTEIGCPDIEGVTVSATILNQIKGKKEIVFKFKPKTGNKKKQGHRQKLTTVKIEKIIIPGKEK